MVNFKRVLCLFFFIFTINFIVFCENAIEFYEKGKVEYFNENYDSAIYNYKESLNINPNYVEPLVDLAHLYYDIENYDYSYKYINKALGLLPERPDLIIFSADIETNLDMINIAEKKYKNILSKDPLNIEAQNGLANLYLKTYKFQLAKKNLENVLKTDANNFFANLMTARYYEAYDKKKANDYYLRNIELNSLNPEGYFYYSIYNYENNRINDAIENILTAIRIKDKTKYKKYYGKYLLYLNKGDEALNIFREIIKTEKNNYLIYYYLAYSYYLVSDYDKAVESLKRAINLREDDEISLYFLNYILIDKYATGYKDRIDKGIYFYNKGNRVKNESKYDSYIFYLKESIRLDPKLIKSRLELADYFLSLNLPERYIRELLVTAKYSDDKDIKDKIEIEKRRISYRLGDDWGINQYQIEQDIFKIPIFAKKGINNVHYNSEKFFMEMLKNSFSERLKFELIVYDENDYNSADKMRISKELDSPFYINLILDENGVSFEASIDLINSYNNELMKRYNIIKNGNDKVLNSAINLIENLNKDIMLKTHIIKISRDKAIINAGRRTGVKLKDKFVILRNKSYNLEFNRGNYIYNSKDIKGYGIIIKVDENISEIKFKDDDFFSDIDIGDIGIYSK